MGFSPRCSDTLSLSLLALPDELILRVLTWLSRDDLSSVGEFRAANRKCKFLTSAVVSTVKLKRNDLKDSHCLQLGEIFPYVDTLALPAAKEYFDFMSHVLPTLRYVQHVKLPLDCARLQPMELKLLVSWCPALRSLAVSLESPDESIPAVATLTQLAHLDIVPATGDCFTGHHLAVIATMTQLTSLSISSLSKANALMSDDQDLSYTGCSFDALSRLTRLRSLSLGNMRYSDAGLKALGVLSCLTQLKLVPDNPSFIAYLSDDALVQLSKMTQLQSLTVDVEERDGRTFLPALASLPDLVELFLKGTMMPGLPKGATFPVLRSLLFEDVYDFEDADVLSALGLSRFCPSLVDCSFRDCDVCTTNVFQCLSLQLNLRSLSLDCVDLEVFEQIAFVHLTCLTRLQQLFLGVKDLQHEGTVKFHSACQAAFPSCDIRLLQHVHN